MSSIALLIALGATAGVSSCPGGSCAAPAYTYAVQANCSGGSCVTYAAAPYVTAQPQPAQPVYTTPQAAPVAVPQYYAPPVAYAPRPHAAPVLNAPAPAYYYNPAAAQAPYGCANGQCYRR